MVRLTQDMIDSVIRKTREGVQVKAIAFDLGITTRQVYYHLDKAGISPKDYFVRRTLPQSSTERFCLSLDRKTYDQLKDIQELYGERSLNMAIQRLLKMTHVQNQITAKQQDVQQGRFQFSDRDPQFIRKETQRAGPLTTQVVKSSRVLLQRLEDLPEAQIKRIEESW